MGLMTTTLQQIFATAVRASLEESGRTQKSLATELGISHKHLSVILNGSSHGSLVLWNRLLLAAGVQIGWKLAPSQIED